MAYYTVTVDGVDICAEFDAVLSKFEQEPPQAKIITVDIPAGVDLDITNAIGATAFHNGLHRFVFAITGADVVARARQLKNRVHGGYKTYSLSWEQGYSYVGRWQVTNMERVSYDAELVTIEVSHYPFKTKQEIIDILANPRGSYRIENSNHYTDVGIRLTQSGSVTFGGSTVSYSAGYHALADTLGNDANVIVNYSDWLYRVVGTNLIVNPEHSTRSGSNVDFDNNFAVVGTNLKCVNEQLQHAYLYFTRKDV